MKLLTKFYYPHFDFQACREELLLPGLEYHAAMVGGGASGAVVGEEDTDTVVVEAAPIIYFEDQSLLPWLEKTLMQW